MLPPVIELYGLTETLNSLDVELVPSEAVTLNVYVVDEDISGDVPVSAPVEEFKEIHDGKLEDE